MNEDSSLYDTLLNLELALLTDEVRLDKARIHELLADDFIEFGSSGTVWRKEDNIGSSGAGSVHYDLHLFHVQPLSTDVVQTTFRIYNRLTAEHRLHSSLWRKRNGKWQMFFHQGTPTTSYSPLNRKKPVKG
ncbi:RNAse H [Pontibacillus halophilus JSM 076056 = DSM 19796]|uniref:RNAse H n=1 Tax=Pontibacillus halophilus JSM 076056 = DSM 19796 TaxID=1385510 RepID=A0A0A5GGI0_9BACI|nr:nuclear transport factor 2 family protein [Pontibacillus halophilus]KGX92351.1 RNAse H [Pontibacillus halophilus JSM 076056 = DSM 19796]